MALQEVEYGFPDPEKKAAADAEALEGSVEVDLDDSDDLPPAKAKPKVEAEIEVVDDVPPQDRNRKPAPHPNEVTEEELSEYSKKVRNRIKTLGKGFHDERRAKEQALREREELEKFTKFLVDENKRLKGTADQNQNAMVEQAKRAVAAELETAKRNYRAALDAGDSDGIVEAQEALTTAKIRADRVANYRPAPLQTKETEVQVPVTKPAQRTVDTRAEDWAAENEWYGQDDEMTAFALGVDAKLKREGVDPRSDTYYERLNARMRQVFPEQFTDDEELVEKPTAAAKPRASNVVAPATRTTAPRKYRLNATQMSLAKRLGISPEQYARQAALLEEKNNGR